MLVYILNIETVDKFTSKTNNNNSESKAYQREDFDYIKQIGEGSFGVVNLVTGKSDDRFYALKILDK